MFLCPCKFRELKFVGFKSLWLPLKLNISMVTVCIADIAIICQMNPLAEDNATGKEKKFKDPGAQL